MAICFYYKNGDDFLLRIRKRCPRGVFCRRYYFTMIASFLSGVLTITFLVVTAIGLSNWATFSRAFVTFLAKLIRVFSDGFESSWLLSACALFPAVYHPCCCRDTIGLLIMLSAVKTPVHADFASPLFDCSIRAANDTELRLTRNDGTAGSIQAVNRECIPRFSTSSCTCAHVTVCSQLSGLFYRRSTLSAKFWLRFRNSCTLL